MKKYAAIPALAAVCGAILLAVRLGQNATGFEAETGLAVPGSLFARLLAAALAATAAILAAAVRNLPAEREDTPGSFGEYFSSAGNGARTLLAMGIYAWIGAGAYTVCLAVLIGGGRLGLLSGLLTAVGGAALFPLLSACHRRGRREGGEPVPARPMPSAALLVTVVCLVVRLVLVYRSSSINPSLQAYYPELLALSLLILGVYRASSFAYHCGRTRRFAFYAAAAAALCLACLADGGGAGELLFWAGGALVMLGLLALRLDAAAAHRMHRPPVDAPEEAESAEEFPGEFDGLDQPRESDGGNG
jgi:hypothetical protein